MGDSGSILALDTAIDDSRKATERGVAIINNRFPNRFSSRDGHQVCYHRLEYDLLFSPLIYSFLLLPCISLCFLSPPRRHNAGVFLSFVLLRLGSSYMSFLIEYVCFPSIIRVAPLVISLRLFYQYSVSFQYFLLSFASYFLVLLCFLTSTLAFHLPD